MWLWWRSPPGDEWQLTNNHVYGLKCHAALQIQVLNPQKPAFYVIFLCMALRSNRSFLKVGLFLGSYCQQLFIIHAISTGQECGAGIRYPEMHHSQSKQAVRNFWHILTTCLVQQRLQRAAFACRWCSFPLYYLPFSHMVPTFLHLIPCLLVGHAHIRCHTQGKSLPQQNTKAPHVTLCGIATCRHQQGAALAKAQVRNSPGCDCLP